MYNDNYQRKIHHNRQRLPQSAVMCNTLSYCRLLFFILPVLTVI